MATYASKLRPSAVDGQTIRVLPDGRIRGNAGMEPFSAGTLGGAPSVFYVDGNVVSSGNGLGWLSAFKTLTEGLAAAHSYMGTSGNRAWAQRATVYACGDALTDTLTKFAEKSDVIGVGSTNQHTHCRIDGTHTLEASSTDNYNGCQFYNFEFYGSSAAAIVTLPANQNGLGFRGCKFSSTDSATIGINATSTHDLHITDCVFDPSTLTVGFSTAAIKIEAGGITNFLVQNCRIDVNPGAGIGIDYNPVTNTTSNCWVIGNFIATNTGMAIDEESDDLWIVDNRWCCQGITAGNSHDLDVKHAVGNIASGSDHTDTVPLATVT